MKKTITVYLLAFLTGINFVIFPALGTVFTDSEIFGLSSSQFGNLFLPQVSCIIISCLVTPFLVNKFGPKIILSFGIALMLLSSGFLWSMQFYLDSKNLIFPILLGLIAMMGFGFGLSITTLNPLVANMFPNSSTSAILILQFLVGLGTSTSPLLIYFAGKPQNWASVPGSIFPSLLLVFIIFLFLKFESNHFFRIPKDFKIPKRLWIFFIAILLYGCIEGALGGFGTIILKEKGLDSASATLGLSLVWGGVALNRLLMGIISHQHNTVNFLILSPLLVGIFLFCLTFITTKELLLLDMFLIGFFMGSIFPEAIGRGTLAFPAYAVMVSGFVLAADQIGTGFITQMLGNFSQKMFLILTILSISTFFIFLLFLFLFFNKTQKNHS